MLNLLIFSMISAVTFALHITRHLSVQHSSIVYTDNLEASNFNYYFGNQTASQYYTRIQSITSRAVKCPP